MYKKNDGQQMYVGDIIVSATRPKLMAMNLPEIKKYRLC
jgi:hypothetical protein